MTRPAIRTRRARGLCIYCGRRPAVARTGCRDCLAYIRDSRKPHGRMSVSLTPDVYAVIETIAARRGVSRARALELVLGAAYAPR
jgi:hypothetical protein